ncbi:MAG: SCO family protein [Rhodospirillales bacterium]|nr:SCO family protein [Rhodospirillales bacterium]
MIAGAVGAAALIGVGEYTMITRNEMPTPVTGGVGGAFSLTRDNGAPFTERDLLGKPAMIYFGYTFCPEVCPTTLTHMSAWLRALGPAAADLQTVFVTIDPERDTAAKLKEYLSGFDPRIIGLTGTPAQIATIARDYKVYYKKVPLPGGSYTMDHSSFVYLMDAKGRLAALIEYGEKDSKAMAALHKLLRGKA